MLTTQTQEKQTMSFNTTTELSATDVANFLDSCQSIGIEADDFNMMIRTIVEHVIDASDEHAPVRELKRPLLFLRMLETFLNNIRLS